MCIMTISAEQHRATMFEGMAHNVGTSLGDCELLKTVLSKRGDAEAVRSIERCEAELRRAYAGFMELFGEAVGQTVPHEFDGTHHHGPQIGNERTFTEVVNDATRHAHDLETR